MKLYNDPKWRTFWSVARKTVRLSVVFPGVLYCLVKLPGTWKVSSYRRMGNWEKSRVHAYYRNGKRVSI